ncbi:MAG: type II secretion system F family protein [Oscillospiraceae bacterium]|nr:type II secretion system F family protein [Oscillospiraceae bacterium]
MRYIKHTAETAEKQAAKHEKHARERKTAIPDYTNSRSGPLEHSFAFITGLAAGTAVLFIFYKILPLSLAGGALIGIANIFASAQASVNKRITKLRAQFYDLLESISVSMRAGNPLISALENAREDLMLIYPEDADIITELDILTGRFNNAVPMSEAFSDLAERSRLEDIAGFASIYATIEGKSGKNDEIVRETQQIIADKMEIEMEIDTLLTAAKTEVNIMLFMPLVILLVIGYAGAGFMDAIYTTGVGRAVSTGGLITFILSYIMAKKFSRVTL